MLILREIRKGVNILFGARLKKLRENSHMTQEEVGSAVGISDRTLGFYENEKRRPNPEMLIALADFFNVTTDYILGRSDDPHSNFAASNALLPTEPIPIKVLGDIRAGRPLFANEHIKGEILMPKEALTSGYDHFVLNVIGDSMIGDSLMERDMVVIRVQNHIDYEGQIAAVIVDDNESCLKHVHFTEDKNYVILRSSNPKYPDIVRPANQVHICGVLSGYFKKAI